MPTRPTRSTSVYPIPTRTSQRVKDDPAFADQYSEIPTLGIALLRLQQRRRSLRRGQARPCPDAKACPTINKDFRIALTQAIDKQAFIDATFAGIGTGGQQLRDAGHARAMTRPSIRIRSISTAAKATWTRPWPSIGYRKCRGHPGAEVRLQHRRRPRAARRVPGRGLATRRSVSRPSRSAASSASSSRSAPPASTTSPGTAGVPTTRTRTTSSAASSPAVAATTTASTATQHFDALLAQAASEPDPDEAGRPVQAGAEDPGGRRGGPPAPLQGLRDGREAWVDGEIVTPIDHNNPGDKFDETIKILKH